MKYKEEEVIGQGLNFSNIDSHQATAVQSTLESENSYQMVLISQVFSFLWLNYSGLLPVH
jgi:hypothetical protein